MERHLEVLRVLVGILGLARDEGHCGVAELPEHLHGARQGFARAAGPLRCRPRQLRQIEMLPFMIHMLRHLLPREGPAASGCWVLAIWCRRVHSVPSAGGNARIACIGCALVCRKGQRRMSKAGSLRKQETSAPDAERTSTCHSPSLSSRNARKSGLSVSAGCAACTQGATGSVHAQIPFR